MLILHDPATLLHSTVELLGAKLIPALESPERIKAILKSIAASKHHLLTLNYELPSDDSNTSSNQDKELSLLDHLSASHAKPYLSHLSSIFRTWLDGGLVEPDSSVLPECFPFPTSLSHPPSEPRDVYARAGYYAFDMSSGITSDTYLSILASANLALEGVKILTAQSASAAVPAPAPNTILALTRPPGHHCDGFRCGGYCYINNAALAVTAYQHYTTSSANPRIAILDLDFHHGNGTQSIFYSSPSPLYVSIHGQDEFPYYTGSASETGAEEGEGYNLNLPLATDSSYEEYTILLETAIEKIKEYAPEFLIVSLGFDTFELDPLGKFGIGTGDYEDMARRVRRGLKVGSEEMGAVRKTLVLLEGGYVIERLGENLMSWIRGWEED
jgi:acetoin utilization deacetylase AcuC-like enzyme